MKLKSILLISLVSILLFVFSGCAKDTHTENTETAKPQTNETQTQKAGITPIHLTEQNMPM